MKRLLHAEWTKLRTLPSTWWLLAATVVLTAAIGAAAASSVTTRICPSPCNADTTKLTLSGVELSQAICLVLGALSIGAEYSTGTIRTTLTAMPSRWRVLASKAVTLSLLTAAAGALGVLSSLGLARVILPTPPDGALLRPATGSILILVLVTLLGLSLATLLRDTAGSITLGLGILYVVPILSHLVNSPTWQHRLQRWAPMPAALSIQATKNLSDLAIAPWPGLSVLAAYAVGLLGAGGVWFRLRDA
ncbi:ABC transporter permease subunit [Streptomyces sp. MBT53]|uniref:ABC transporter permease subunit n=1 Tax=Streptomyces sp. MBT53 TaxID=1488384 RepID=UPI00191213C6|nr:ABC transporter permease subunit [Streptomyces sp. MBT53]MBK6015932.1 ABC transporter permease subunit [Streptomyces sp. MBT53]